MIERLKHLLRTRNLCKYCCLWCKYFKTCKELYMEEESNE